MTGWVGAQRVTQQNRNVGLQPTALTTYQLCLMEQNSLSYRHGLPVSRTQGCDPGWPSMATGFRQSMPERRAWLNW